MPGHGWDARSSVDVGGDLDGLATLFLDVCGYGMESGLRSAVVLWFGYLESRRQGLPGALGVHGLEIRFLAVGLLWSKISTESTNVVSSRGTEPDESTF